jgi:predicted ester cyclase
MKGPHRIGPDWGTPARRATATGLLARTPHTRAHERPVPTAALLPLKLITFAVSWGTLGLYCFFSQAASPCFGGITTKPRACVPAVQAPAFAAFAVMLHFRSMQGAVAAPCCTDVVWEGPAAPHTLLGRDAVRRFHSHIMFPALPDTPIELIDGPHLALDGTGVAARLRISGTMTGPLTPPGFAPTGGRLSFETAQFAHIEGGLLSRHAVVLNMIDLAQRTTARPSRCKWRQSLSAPQTCRFWPNKRCTSGSSSASRSARDGRSAGSGRHAPCRRHAGGPACSAAQIGSTPQRARCSSIKVFTSL